MAPSSVTGVSGLQHSNLRKRRNIRKAFSEAWQSHPNLVVENDSAD